MFLFKKKLTILSHYSIKMSYSGIIWQDTSVLEYWMTIFHFLKLQRLRLVVKKQVLNPKGLGSNPASIFGER
jgi:hypothetical protein